VTRGALVLDEDVATDYGNLAAVEFEALTICDGSRKSSKSSIMDGIAGRIAL